MFVVSIRVDWANGIYISWEWASIALFEYVLWMEMHSCLLILYLHFPPLNNLPSDIYQNNFTLPWWNDMLASKRSVEGEKWSNYYPFDDRNVVTIKCIRKTACKKCHDKRVDKMLNWTELNWIVWCENFWSNNSHPHALFKICYVFDKICLIMVITFQITIKTECISQKHHLTFDIFGQNGHFEIKLFTFHKSNAWFQANAFHENPNWMIKTISKTIWFGTNDFNSLWLREILLNSKVFSSQCTFSWNGNEFKLGMMARIENVS